MENQEPRICCKRKNCLCTILIILLSAFLFVLGGIIGALVSEFVMTALAAIVVLAIILGLLTLLTIILMICKKEKLCC